MSRLRIDYTALSLTHPERVRFRYRLEGFDPDWVDVGTRRTAIFTNLAPGRYRFRVQARTSDGAWNESAQAWRFAIQPALHQTRVFQLGLLGLVAAGLWGGWRLRLRTVRREIALVFAERTRVSREIHDTLLQSLVGLALQLDVVARRLGAQPAERDQVTRIRRLVEDYIRDARQSIWDLRSSDLQALGLVNAMQRLGRRVTEEAGVRVDLTVTGRERACPPKVQMHLLRIAQEAMANAIRHGRAQGLHLELAFLDRSLRLSVVDDGCGFDPACLANLPDGHFGLAGMRERAEDVGGRFTVNTAHGEGTTIETVIPLPTHA
jgi:signal transduction histidine kinase